MFKCKKCKKFTLFAILNNGLCNKCYWDNTNDCEDEIIPNLLQSSGTRGYNLGGNYTDNYIVGVDMSNNTDETSYKNFSNYSNIDDSSNGSEFTIIDEHGSWHIKSSDDLSNNSDNSESCDSYGISSDCGCCDCGGCD